jgi:hypothetical protein
LPALFRDSGQQALDDGEWIAIRQGGVRWKKPVKQIDCVQFRLMGDRLGQVSEPDEQQEDERNRRQQRVKGQGAGKKRNVVFISGLQGAAEEAGGGSVPPAGP